MTIIVLGFLYPGGRSPSLDQLAFLVLGGATVWTAARDRPLLRYFRDLRYRGLALALGLCFLVGHLADDPERTYPFVGWTMYSDPEHYDVLLFEFEGRTAAGDAVDFFPSAGGKLTVNILPFDFRRRAQYAFATRSFERIRRLRERCLAVARLYNEGLGSGEHVRVVDVYLLRMPHGHFARADGERSLLWEFRLPDADGA